MMDLRLFKSRIVSLGVAAQFHIVHRQLFGALPAAVLHAGGFGVFAAADRAYLRAKLDCDDSDGATQREAVGPLRLSVVSLWVD